VALICACLPIMRIIFTAGFTKISSHTGLSLRKSQSNRSSIHLALSPANFSAGSKGSVPVSRISPMSPTQRKSPRLPLDGSQVTNLVRSDSLGGEEPRTRYYTSAIVSAGSNSCLRGDMKPRSEMSEKVYASTGVGSPESESSSYPS
jgi:hypothetical protein